MKKILLLIIILAIISTTACKNSSSKDYKLTINSDKVTKVIIRTKPSYGKILVDKDHISEVINFINSISFNGEAELKPGWTYAIDILGNEKYDIMIMGDNFYVDDKGHKIEPEVLEKFQEIYKNLPVTETKIDILSE